MVLSLWVWKIIPPGNALRDMHLSKCEAQTFLLVSFQTTENHSVHLFCVENTRSDIYHFTGGKYLFAQGKDSVPRGPDQHTHLERSNGMSCNCLLGVHIFKSSIFLGCQQPLWSGCCRLHPWSLSTVPHLSRYSVRKTQVCRTKLAAYIHTVQ